ncbi:hypothetical protein PGT21_018629 [Puccinia graminis f. sp. tritici]|uniref:Uncharacterized protein n=1 Tax=Puccinia graminis f. sp. tritici TaxID=56615 RepID=A0A5B0PAD5_PUCGR|nr:hypothetical protein PGT21_018629 [Puccinia graminis f. sp. tritici]KAA1126032.1 hypothetical protein PGTUg99_014704 [Puccinia graminis f. sp. tritici]
MHESDSELDPQITSYHTSAPFPSQLEQSHIRSGTTLDPKEAALEGSVGGGAYAKWDMQNTTPPSRMQNDMLA